MGWKINDLQPASLPLSGGELIELSQGGSSRKVSVHDFLPGFDNSLSADLANGADTDKGASMVMVAPVGGGVSRSVRDHIMKDGAVSLLNWPVVGNANYWNGTAWFADAAFTTPAHDDTAAIQAAFNYCAANYKTLLVPSGTPFLITSRVSCSNTFPIVGEGPSSSELLGQAPHNKGAVFVSTVAGDFAMWLGGGAYQRSLYLSNFRLYTKHPTGRGLIIQNTGWDGRIQDITVEGFRNGGVYFQYVQDTQIDSLGIIDCGKDNEYAALAIRGGSNQLTFTRLHIEVSEWMMQISETSGQIVFNGSHFESGEYANTPDGSHPYYYPLGTSDHLRYATGSMIRIDSGSLDVAFYGCTFSANTVQGVVATKLGGYNAATFDGTAELSVPFMISVQATAVSFSHCFFAGYGGSYSYKFLNMGSSYNCDISNCRFSGIWCYGAGIILSGSRFTNNVVDFSDQSQNYIAPGNTRFYGIHQQNEYSLVENNYFVAVNGTKPNKTDGIIFSASYPGSGPRPTLGANNTFSIQKSYLDHSSDWEVKYGGSTVRRTLAAGSLDLRLHPVNSLFAFAGNTPLTDIVNPCQGQEVNITNDSATAVSIASTSTLKLKGAVAASVPQYGMITMQQNLNGLIIEKSRSF